MPKVARKEPCQEWIDACLKWRGRVLIGGKAHWCDDWDGLPVDETTTEYECCTCTGVAPAKGGK